MKLQIEILYEQRTFSFGQVQDSIRAQKTVSDICTYAIKSETFLLNLWSNWRDAKNTYLSTWEFILNVRSIVDYISHKSHLLHTYGYVYWLSIYFGMLLYINMGSLVILVPVYWGLKYVQMWKFWQGEKYLSSLTLLGMVCA